MLKFKKRPIIVEAFRMTKERRWDNSEWPEWMHQAWQKEPNEAGCLYCVDDDGLVGPGERLCITMSNGIHTVMFGDYIIQGIKGEIYPCNTDIFEQTYEAVGSVE